eukprot:m.9844 g.9844  ORF g.9844 m.9844 type:complete len:173 (+) comp5484_c0_seq2:87-605(+)
MRRLSIALVVKYNRFFVFSLMWLEVRRDPRFDDLSGKLNPDLFRKTYDFLAERRAQDQKELQKALQKTKSHEHRERIQSALKSMADRERSEQQQESTRQIRAEHRKEERERVAEGKKPFFLKKSAEKKIELLHKYEEVQKTGRIDQAIGTRRKHTATKGRRGLPSRREHDDA